MDLVEHGLSGTQYLDNVTDLLRRIRSEEPGGGPWDAADLQWWSRSGRYDDPDRLRFWSKPNAPSSVCALFPVVGDTIVLTCLWTSEARDAALKDVLPNAVAAAQRIAKDQRLTIDIEVIDTDVEWRQFLECRGFTPTSGGSTQAAVRTSDVPGVLCTDASLTICDDTQGAHNEDPHPLERRLGSGIRRRLMNCSLYRRDLDLSVRTTNGEVVAYCICWADPTNRFAMLEPMRTEDAWQRRGLAAALIAEQARRLRRHGIGDLKVNYATDNPAAQRLYARSNFVERFRRVLYRWVAPGGSDASG